MMSSMGYNLLIAEMMEWPLHDVIAEMEMSWFWWNVHHWMLQKLWFGQLSMKPVIKVVKIITYWFWCLQHIDFDILIHCFMSWLAFVFMMVADVLSSIGARQYGPRTSTTTILTWLHFVGIQIILYWWLSARKTAVTPLLMHWSYCSLVLSHWYVLLFTHNWVQNFCDSTHIKISYKSCHHPYFEWLSPVQNGRRYGMVTSITPS